MIKYKLDNIEKMSLHHIKRLELVRNGDKGASSRVYSLNYNECIKLFNEYKDEFELKRYHDYTKLNFDCAALPKTLYLINNKFRALKMDCINGIMLSELEPYMEYSKYVMLANQLIQSSKEISEEGIVIYDSHSHNIMYNYDKDRFVLIDQDEWSVNRVDSEEAKRLNFRILNNTLRSTLFNNDFSIGNLKESLDEDGDFIDYYETERELAEKKIGQKIITIGEFRRAIR